MKTNLSGKMYSKKIQMFCNFVRKRTDLFNIMETQEDFYHIDIASEELHEQFRAWLRRYGKRFASKERNHIDNFVWLAPGLHCFDFGPISSMEEFIVKAPEYGLKMSSYDDGVVDVELL